MITVMGFPRSGTNFLHRMLAHYIDGPMVDRVWDGMGEHPEVRKIHWPYQLRQGEPIVFIAREPKNNAVSAWQYFLSAYAKGEWDIMRFLRERWSRPWRMWPHGWRELHEMMHNAPDIVVTYESLYWNRKRELYRIAHAIGLPIDAARARWAIYWSHRIGNTRERYGREGTLPGKVEPRPGQNVELLTDDEKDWIDDYLDGFDLERWGL